MILVRVYGMSCRHFILLSRSFTLFLSSIVSISDFPFCHTLPYVLMAESD